MSDFEPLPIEEVMSIVDRRARRQRAVLRGVLGAGAVAVVGVGAAAIGRDESSSSDSDTASDVSLPPSSTTSTTRPIPAGTPQWQIDAAARAFDAVGFDFDDASLIGELWNVDPFTAKAVVGESVRTGVPGDVGRLLADPNQDDADRLITELTDPYWASYDDIAYADALAEAWSTGVFDAKVLAGLRLLAGEPVEGS